MNISQDSTHSTQNYVYMCLRPEVRRRARSQKDRDVQAVAAAGGRMEQLVRLRVSEVRLAEQGLMEQHGIKRNSAQTMFMDRSS